MMKNKRVVFLLLLMIVVITGCSRYEKDYSTETDLYGSYSKNTEATNVSYSSSVSYTFYENNEYNYLNKEVIEGTITKDINKDGKVILIEEISNDITKLVLDQEVVELWSEEAHNESIYKYKNMLGSFYETSIPDDKTFDLKSDDFDFWFDKDGQYHLCVDTSGCDCNINSPKYIRKDDIIYFQLMDEEHKNTYTIGAYIVDKGLFFPELYKTTK